VENVLQPAFRNPRSILEDLHIFIKRLIFGSDVTTNKSLFELLREQI